MVAFRYGTNGEGLVYPTAVMVFLQATPQVYLSVSMDIVWPYNACSQSTFLRCKMLLVTDLTHVSSATAGARTFTLYLLHCCITQILLE